MKDPHTGDVRGFGFVNFATPEQAEAAIDAINGTEFLGKVLTVQKARRGRARTPTRTSRSTSALLDNSNS